MFVWTVAHLDLEGDYAIRGSRTGNRNTPWSPDTGGEDKSGYKQLEANVYTMSWRFSSAAPLYIYRDT